MTNTTIYEGHVDPGFEGVAASFSQTLESGGGGASLGIYHQGKPVVNLWGGLADQSSERPWREHTITLLASTSKALATISLLHLIDRGKVHLDAPIAQYWPEFAQQGKDKVLVRHLLSMSSGLAALDTPITPEESLAYLPVLQKIEQQKLWWASGTKHGYHAVSYGYLVSGLVFKVTGERVGTYFADQIAKPLDLDLYLGTDAEKHDIAPIVTPSTDQALSYMQNPDWLNYFAELSNESSVSYKATFGGTSATFDDKPAEYRYDIEDASAGGLGNGYSLAKLFAALSGLSGQPPLIDPALLSEARREQAGGHDEVLKMETRWGLGFMLPGGPTWPDLGVGKLFGFGGASGSMAFSDIEHQLTFGYVPNKWAELGGQNGTERSEELIRATYDALLKLP